MARDEPFAVKWVKRESKACVCAHKQAAQHNRQRWNGCPVISSEKCSNQTKQRVCSTFFGFQQDMLNRRCSTPGTQAHWINKHHRSNEDCCVSLNPVFVWANTQWAGKYHLSYVFYLIFPKWIAFAPFKNHCWIYIFRKWESCEFTLNCGWVSFHFKSHFFLFFACFGGSCQWLSWENNGTGFLLLPSCVWKPQCWSLFLQALFSTLFIMFYSMTSWKSPPPELSHLLTHDNKRNSVVFNSFWCSFVQVE